ncbi:terminase small subunit [Rhodobacter aestuarii]|uniref:Terminase small subunit n=1 Tax=Rhodobacter aestuarii TaxID=453582 RepID=A0A1N7Q2T9_9RHOB|nr:terminase small subunit [Rhodobacter aestuarii]PTV94063.1 terminase small subunit [Rhodobacter aestuarii]SIT17168.1 Terminase small subunit [Rhodobacter aestuarii]
MALPSSLPNSLVRPVNPRQQRFCQEYLIDLNATQAAIRAGYARANADQQASRLLKDPRVMAQINVLKAERSARLKLSGDDVIRQLARIAFADRRNLMALHLGACRYCWGKSHEFHWRSAREYREACDSAQAEGRKVPLASGGFGYRLTARPDPNCPECDGLGIRYVWYADSANLGPDELALFEGVRQTRNGIELKTPSRLKALELLAEHFGLFKANNQADPAAPFRNMLAQLLGASSKAPLKR